MTGLFNWLKPKKVEVPEIRPVLLDDVEAAQSTSPELDEEVRRARGEYAKAVDRHMRTAADIRLSLARATLSRHERG